MAEKIKENSVETRVKPIEIEDKETGKVYTLDFNRESVMFAESRGFEIENVLKYPTTNFPELFYLAFRANHGLKNGNISKTKTNEIYDSFGGLSPEVVERLVLLYNQAAYSNIAVETTEEMEKNGKWAVRL